MYLSGCDGGDVAVFVSDSDPNIILVRGGVESVAFNDQGVALVDLEGVGKVDVGGVLDVLQHVVPSCVRVVKVQQTGDVVHPEPNTQVHRRRKRFKRGPEMTRF